MRVREIVIAASLLVSATLAQAQTVTFINPTVFPNDPRIVENEVYGFVKYTVGRPRTYDLPPDFFAGIKASIRELIGEEESANVTITLEVLRGNTLLVREPLMTLETKDKTFLFNPANHSRVMRETESRTIIDYAPITNATNKLTVKFGVYVTTKTELDLSTIQKIVQLESLISGGTTAELSEPTKLLLSKVQEISNQVLGSNSTDTNENSTEMSFIKESGGVLAPKKRLVEIQIKAKLESGETKLVKLPIQVDFGTRSSRLRATFNNRKFDPDSLTTDTYVGADLPDGSGKIADSLRMSENEKIRSFLDQLLGKDEKYSGNDIAIRCSQLYEQLSKYLTKRDMAGYFYSFVIAKRENLKASNNGSACMTQTIKTDFEKYGLTPPTL